MKILIKKAKTTIFDFLCAYNYLLSHRIINTQNNKKKIIFALKNRLARYRL